MKKVLDFIVIVSVFLVVFVVGCKKSVTTESASISTPVSDAVEKYIPAQTEYSTVSQCPVMGEKVMVGKKTMAAKYKGKIYYFCCPDCMSKFKAEPGRYAK
ncbi:MAG: YHS domain-containing protein [Elusimicrobia bacterium]|nr:YHS domain-containing protein [Elusimicrobiota bacterium]